MRKPLLSLFLIAGLIISAPATFAKQSRAHRQALRICKQKYKDAIRGTRYLKGNDRRARRAKARHEREECERLAPK
jgi:hypothetical protein